jgi:protein-S-isoprenylcysteine O-methyltransferase Ste14
VNRIWILLRAATYAVFFTGVLLIFVPEHLLSSASLVAPRVFGVQQLMGVAITLMGGMLGTWCILTFVFVGRGTQAPFDPPRHLVVRGPYRALRNPMYAGASLALSGASLYYSSAVIFVYAIAFWLIAELVVVRFEEPYLRRAFGTDYQAYCELTGRWWPRRMN